MPIRTSRTSQQPLIGFKSNLCLIFAEGKKKLNKREGRKKKSKELCSVFLVLFLLPEFHVPYLIVLNISHLFIHFHILFSKTRSSFPSATSLCKT